MHVLVYAAVSISDAAVMPKAAGALTAKSGSQRKTASLCLVAATGKLSVHRHCPWILCWLDGHWLPPCCAKVITTARLLVARLRSCALSRSLLGRLETAPDGPKRGAGVTVRPDLSEELSWFPSCDWCISAPSCQLTRPLYDGTLLLNKLETPDMVGCSIGSPIMLLISLKRRVM